MGAKRAHRDPTQTATTPPAVDPARRLATTTLRTFLRLPLLHNQKRKKNELIIFLFTFVIQIEMNKELDEAHDARETHYFVKKFEMIMEEAIENAVLEFSAMKFIEFMEQFEPHIKEKYG